MKRPLRFWGMAGSQNRIWKRSGGWRIVLFSGHQFPGILPTLP